MTTRETSIEFLSAFCAGDVEGVAALLTEDLQFEGPLHQFGSREAYLRFLREDPPESADYEVLRVTVAGADVSLLWEYRKPEGIVLIAQWNRFRGERIAEITLVFDTRSFA